MSRAVHPSLTPALVARFAQGDLGGRLGVVLPLVTVDRDGRPHPMVVTYLEVRAYDTRTVGLVIHADSGSAHNLVERRVATLIVIEPDAIVYVKMRAVDGPLDVAGGDKLGLGYFLLEVEQVIEDAAAGWEAGMSITAAPRYGPPPNLDAPWVRITLQALKTPRARA
ncbi:MAG TPA: pyridoxamine 5'-phosphate oxidase family protein [Methylomirabilota bacterium]|jgi:hypothetical protein|nr:pyridoxamine 5'-phosphate oxidase family protein [Methylomirabilota bacterium]